MINFFKSFPKHFMSAIKNLVRHLAMTISSVSAVAVTLTLMAMFVLLAGNINGFTSNVEKDLKIHVTIDNIKTDTEINAIKTKIEKIAGIKSVTFSSSEQELDILVEENGNVFGRYKKNNPLPNVFIVEVEKAKDITAVTQKLNKINGVDKAQYGGEGIETMVKAFESLRIGGAIFMLGLLFIAVFLISNTIKMTIYTRKTEISIMRNVGATNWYIKTPFMIEGMFIGIMGALLPILITLIGYSALYDSLNGQFLSSMLVMQKPFPFAALICLFLLVSGAIVGIIGSFHAVNRHLRWSR